MKKMLFLILFLFSLSVTATKLVAPKCSKQLEQGQIYCKNKSDLCIRKCYKHSKKKSRKRCLSRCKVKLNKCNERVRKNFFNCLGE